MKSDVVADEALIEAVKSSSSLAEVLRKLGKNKQVVLRLTIKEE